MAAAPKIRAFLDTDVLLDYLRGKPELQLLFSPEVEDRVSFAVNPVVLQELLLASGAVDQPVDLNRLTKHLEIVGAEELPAPNILNHLRELRNRLAHANDLMILESSSHCDVLLTYNKALLELGNIAEVESETPEEFLNDLQLAS
jgi:predicted nucleic acid-binding protein